MQKCLYNSWKIFRKTGKWILRISGVLFLILLILSFTDIPYYAYHKLGSYNSDKVTDPDLIVVLGGAGMPSPDGLIRTYYAAGAANHYLNAPIVIAHPMSSDSSKYQIELMENELIIRGIDPSRIVHELNGYNTYTQAGNIATLTGAKRSEMEILVITSPEHVYRAVKCFEKFGFKHVGGEAAIEKPLEERSLKSSDENKISENLNVRYNMWNYLRYEILVLREYCAIFYYSLRGWI